MSNDHSDHNNQDPNCSCPSGNGSLVWPCPVHRPEFNIVFTSGQKDALRTDLGDRRFAVLESRSDTRDSTNNTASIDLGTIAVQLIEKRAADYLRDHASTEYGTGDVVFHRGDAGRDHHSTLIELADDLRVELLRRSTSRRDEIAGSGASGPEVLAAALCDVLAMHTNLSTDAMDELGPLLAAQAVRTLDRAAAASGSADHCEDPRDMVDHASRSADWIGDVIRDVAELPDRDSPACQPDMMLVSGDELRDIVAARAPAASNGGDGTAARDVLAERRRQIEAEGYDPENDDAHVLGEIGAYAAYYAMPPGVREWPATETGYADTFGEAIVPGGWTPPRPGDRRRELVKAGALILAEIERIDRAANKTATNEGEQKGGAA